MPPAPMIGSMDHLPASLQDIPVAALVLYGVIALVIIKVLSSVIKMILSIALVGAIIYGFVYIYPTLTS